MVEWLKSIERGVTVPAGTIESMVALSLKMTASLAPKVFGLAPLQLPVVTVSQAVLVAPVKKPQWQVEVHVDDTRVVKLRAAFGAAGFHGVPRLLLCAAALCLSLPLAAQAPPPLAFTARTVAIAAIAIEYRFAGDDITL